jgi:hypothetical protein
MHCNARTYTQQNNTVQHAPRRVRNHDPSVQLAKYLLNLEYEATVIGGDMPCLFVNILYQLHVRKIYTHLKWCRMPHRILWSFRANICEAGEE